MTTVDKMLRRYLTSARDFEAAGWAATEDRDKFPLWERAALAGMCAYLLQSLVDGRDVGDVADHLADADEDGQNLSGWVSRQLLAHGLEAPLDAVEATPQPAPSNCQPWELAGLVMLRSPDGSVHAHPGLGETLHRIDTDFLVFVGDDPDTAKVQIDADGIDDAAGFLAAIPGSAIAIREVYAGEWAVNRPVAVDRDGEVER